MEQPLLAALTIETRNDLLAHVRRRRFGRRETIFHDGDPSDGMYLVDAGWAAVRVSTPLGDVGTLAVVGPGEPLGEQSLVRDDVRRSASAVALTAIETLYISRKDFNEIRADHPAVDRFLVALFDDRMRRLSARLIEALYLPAPQRVLRRVAEVAEAFGADGRLPLTQEDIATLAGTTRPTVNRALRDAEGAGLLSLSRGTIQVLKPSALV